MENVAVLVMLLLAAGSTVAALRVWRKMRVLRYQSILQRAAIGMCADVMGDENNSASLKSFAGTLSVMFMSERSLDMFSRGPEHVRKLMGLQGHVVRESKLSESDRKIISPALEAFGFAAMLYDEKYSAQICKMFDASLSDAYRTSRGAKPAKVTSVARPEPVEKRLQKIEELVEWEARNAALA